MRKPAIPTIPKDNGSEKFNKTVKECLETIMGRRSDQIKPLNADASSSDVINKINEIIERLQ
jgi:hypothetical protein